MGGAGADRASPGVPHAQAGGKRYSGCFCWLWGHLEIVQPLRDLSGVMNSCFPHVFGEAVSLRPLMWKGAASHRDAWGCFLGDVTSAFLAREQEGPASDASRSLEDRKRNIP